MNRKIAGGAGICKYVEIVLDFLEGLAVTQYTTITIITIII